MSPLTDIRAVCFDWGGTIMADEGPEKIPMALWPEVKAIDGAEETLAMLHRKLPLALATNAASSGSTMIQIALKRVGFVKYFKHIYCYTEVRHRKDHPKFWAAIQQSLDLPLNHIAMIGDSYHHDAVAPRSFGVQTVWYNPTGSTEHQDSKIPTVQDLRLFAQWVVEAK